MCSLHQAATSGLSGGGWGEEEEKEGGVLLRAIVFGVEIFRLGSTGRKMYTEQMCLALCPKPTQII